MKLAISMSLSIKDDRAKSNIYVEGFKRNVDVISSIYPEASLILHHDNTVSENISKLANKAVLHEYTDDSSYLFWRFLSVNDPEFDSVLIRDADSVVSDREAGAVNEWLQSPFKLHTMHDHQHHWPTRMLGGMWGAKRNALPYDFQHLVKWWLKNKGPFSYDSDQQFLSRYVHPYTYYDGMNHWGGSVPRTGSTRPFPNGHSPSVGYVGERITVEP